MTPVAVPETVVLFSTADWGERYWTNKQHIARRLADRGARVLYIESTGFRAPGFNARDLRRIVNRLDRAQHSPEQVGERLWVHAPLTIPVGQRFGAVQAFNGMLLRAAVKSWLRSHGTGRVVVWTFHPYHETAIRGLDAAVVYHCVDDIAAVPGVDGRAFAAAERLLLETADVVFTTSPKLAEHCAAIAGDRVAYERNVADVDHFARARAEGEIPLDVASIPHPRLAYVGVLSDFKLDLGLLETLAKRRPDWHFIFIGEEPERQRSETVGRLRILQNVHFLGYRPYDALPDHLRGIDVALLPNLTTGYMASVFPMKFYEYLAAGKPIVATPIPAIGDLEDLVAIADGAQAWEMAVTAVLTAPPTPVPIDDPRLASYTWDARMDRMLHHLAEVEGRRGEAVA